jgi:subtilase family serine protease
MKKAFSLIIVIVMGAGLLGAIPASGFKGASPMFVMGPQAQPAAVAGPEYGLFTCQVGMTPYQCYDPYQMRTAYGTDFLIASGYDGQGMTIIIIDAFQSDTLEFDLNTFISFYGLPGLNGLGNPYDPDLGTFTQIAPDGLGPVDDGWAGEITLDVEWAHAIAPGANITLVLGKDNSDEALVSALNYAIDNDLGDVVSMSFGEADTCLGPELTAAWHQAFVNATKKGITLFASSGDQGAALPSCDNTTWLKVTSSPASDPLVVAVGGTELHAANYCLAPLGCDPTTNPAPGTYLGEIAWNEGPIYGDYQTYFASTLASGGGFSTVWDLTSYQQGTLKGMKMRGEPDVAYNAAVLHGVLTYLGGDTGGWYLFGGTSAGSPQWAALTAIADQIAGHDFGFINAALYKIGQNATPYANTFYDITSGNNSAMEFDENGDPVDIIGYDARTGWDAVTGLGSPKAVSVVTQLPLFWSAGQGNAAINQSKAHPNQNASNEGFEVPK